jgi:hypothetical protein
MINICENDQESDNTVHYFRIDGFIDWVPREADGSRQLIFLACDECKGKLVDEGHGFYCN